MGHSWSIKLQIHHKIILQEVNKKLISSIVALLVFDITSYQSFENLQRWLEEVRTNAN